MSDLSKTLWVLPAVVMLCASAVLASESVTITHNIASRLLALTENQRQWDEQVLYRANAGEAIMWFTKDGVYYQFTRRIPSLVGRNPCGFDNCLIPPLASGGVEHSRRFTGKERGANHA